MTMSIIPLDQLNVLIVDDSAHMRNLLAGILRALGVAEVFSAANVSEGYRKLTLKPIDVAFVDWEMPPDSGLDFVKQIRLSEDSPNPYVPIIMLTGNNEMAHVMAARDTGIHEFLAKPVSPRSVYGRLLSVLHSPRPFVRVGDYFGPDRRRRDSGFGGEGKRETDCEPEAEADGAGAGETTVAGPAEMPVTGAKG